MSKIYKSSLVYYVIVPLLIIVTSGGVVFASEDSLPDSILYPIKTKVVEPVRKALITSKESKANYESQLATKRLVEAELLAKQGKLDAVKEKKLNDLLIQHTADLNDILNEIDDSGYSDEVDDIIINFNAGMNAHAHVLDSIMEDEEVEDESEEEDKKIKISKTARIKPDTISSKLKKEEEGEDNEDDDLEKPEENNKSKKYKKRKDDVEYLINETFDYISDMDEDLSVNKKDILDDTSETLNKAKELFDEADRKEEDGDSHDAYNTLIDSESSIKEAKIFLHTRLKENDDDEKDDENDD